MQCINPNRMNATISNSDQNPGTAEMPVDPRTSQGLQTGIVLSLITMMMLTVIAEPVGWSPLAWVALVPWLIAVTRLRRGSAWVGYLTGTLYFLVNLYWLWPVTGAGMVALCLYLGLYFLLCGVILRWVYLYRPWPFTLVLPVVWVGQEYLRATVMTGFAWFFLGHSQHDNVMLIQMSDMFGAYGVTFVVAMCNGLWGDLLLRPLKRRTATGPANHFGASTMILLTACCIAAALLYGQHRLRQGRRTITAGPVVTVVQDNIPQHVKQQQVDLNGDDIFHRHVALTEAALETTPVPDLIVWPETMVLSELNDDMLAGEVTEFTRQSHRFNHRLKQLAGRGSALLVGAPSMELSGEGGVNRYNSAQYYLADGSRHPKRYDKIHLVPFGEVVPFKKSWPWMYRLLNKLTPYDYEYSNTAGEDPTVFDLAKHAGAAATPDDKCPWKFSVAICYEDVMPHVPRRLAAEEYGKKRIDFLLNISNEGWFSRGGHTRNDPVKPTAELSQHWAICKFRAVENRVSIVRSVNMGISGFVRPDGRVQTKPLAGTLPDHPRKRQAVAGFLTDTVQLDSRVSVYNKIGDIFAILCTVVTALLFLDGRLVRRGLSKKMRQKTTG